MRDEYISFVFATYIRSKKFDELFGGDWIDGELLPNLKLAAIRDAFEMRGLTVNPLNFEHIFESIFAEVLAAGGLVVEGDDLLGHWYRIDADVRNRAVRDILGRSEAARKLSTLGEKSFEALDTALRKIVYELPSDVADDDRLSDRNTTEEFAPAADRIVRFNDNEVNEVVEPLQSLISLVEKENSVGGDEGVRELILGRLKAGRELISAAIFSMESLRLTLIVGLQMLVERYKEHAIGAAAGNLLALIIEAVRNA